MISRALRSRRHAPSRRSTTSSFKLHRSQRAGPDAGPAFDFSYNCAITASSINARNYRCGGVVILNPRKEIMMSVTVFYPNERRIIVYSSGGQIVLNSGERRIEQPSARRGYWDASKFPTVAALRAIPRPTLDTVDTVCVGTRAYRSSHPRGSRSAGGDKKGPA